MSRNESTFAIVKKGSSDIITCTKISTEEASINKMKIICILLCTRKFLSTKLIALKFNLNTEKNPWGMYRFDDGSRFEI